MGILFVCTGNTCRSPMACALFQAATGGGMACASAGLYAFPGEGASQGALKAMAERGLNLSAHRAQLASRTLLEGADLVLTMTQAQAEAARRMAPRARIETLKGFIGQRGDIVDPYGGDESIYRVCAQEIGQAVARVADKLRAQNGWEVPEQGHVEEE